MSTHSTPAPRVFKGKDVRSWQQLPPEIIRYVATHYLVLSGETAYTPNTWVAKEMWPSRLVYIAFRNASEIEKLMAVCPSWEQALEHHRLWHHACAALDPQDCFAQFGFGKPSATAGSVQAPLRLSPYRQFRYISTNSCVVCRINFPFSNHGLAASKRIVVTPYFNAITTCRDHRKATYCSLCLRTAPADDTHSMVCCAENEDEETWPIGEATCRSCRSEWLWRRVSMSPLDCEAFSAPPARYKNIVDWEVRQAVDTFIDMGEGCIGDVLCLAREKHWLRTHTKIAELLDQALAANRYARAESGYDGSEDELSGDDEDDPEYMSLTEDAGGIRELSITDWARNRILDGYWISPADQYYSHVLPGQPPIPAVHPCPWLGATYSGALVDGESTGDGEELEHPRPRTYRAPCPPTYQLCEAVHRTYQRVLREILLPAMVNIVRRLVIECTADGTDAAQRALKMRLEDVVGELRDHATWTRGVDWLELRAVRAREERERDRARGRRTGSEEDDGSLSSRSDGSHTTSPVLSTTTLQTTPSPPPCEKDEESISSPTAAAASAMAVPMSPSLHTKELLRPIPYVPVQISEMPQFSYESIKHIWREACAPLYQCRCSICERAILKANMETNATGEGQPPQAVAPVQQQPVQIRIEDPAIIALREEEEEEEEDLDFDDGESEQDDVDGVEYDTLQQDLGENPFYVAPDAEAKIEPGATTETVPLWETGEMTDPMLWGMLAPSDGAQDPHPHPPPPPESQRTRKRSYDEDEKEALDDVDMFKLMGVQPRKIDGVTTPPKRQRTDGVYTPTSTAAPSPTKLRESLATVPLPTPIRARKRSSEELEDTPQEVVAQTPSGKRVKASHGGDRS